MQRRLDQTLGKPGSYHHGSDREGQIKPMTIGARLYRLENQVMTKPSILQSGSYDMIQNIMISFILRSFGKIRLNYFTLDRLDMSIES